jgi:P-type Ca2+ transporter type 2C
MIHNLSRTGTMAHLMAPVEVDTASSPNQFYFHAKPLVTCLQYLGSGYGGLSPQEAADRLALYQGRRDKKTMAGRLWMVGFKNRMTWMLLAAAVLSFVRMDAVSGVMILVAMLVNGAIQGLIHLEASKTESLVKAREESNCRVRRNDKVQVVPVAELVPGDVLVLESGDLVPADARLINTVDLQCDESFLTGESVLVRKDAKALHFEDQEVTEQANMLFAGTRVKTGKGEALVVAIGKDTVMGRIKGLAGMTDKSRSPFTRDLGKLSNRMALLVFVMAAFVAAIEYQRGADVLQLIQLALILAVAALPETLPGMVNLVLSLGLRRLADEKILVKNVHALETIGDITIVCTDKTGTLTENHLIFDRLYLPDLGEIPYNQAWLKGQEIGPKSVEEFLRIARLNNTTEGDGLRSIMMGDPIDAALFNAVPALLGTGYRRKECHPFDKDTLLSAMVYETPVPESWMMSYIKGAPEAVLDQCKYYLDPDGNPQPMDMMKRVEFSGYNRDMAEKHNYRIIGFAEKRLTESDGNTYGNAVFVGWVYLLDPAKPGVVEAVQGFQKRHIDVVMITGDQKPTAEVTARQLGILKRDGMVWNRYQLEECDGKIPDYVRVFARTRPEEKLRIVECMQQTGHCVAMVGDGVNDAPAMEKSDVAIAMGLRGSETAKNSADIILLSDRLGGILTVMERSRQLRRHMVACIQFLVSCNLGLLFFVTASVVSGQGQPLNLVEILWLNLLITSLPTLMLALQSMFLDEAEPMVEDPGERQIFNGRNIFMTLFWAGFVMAAGLGVFLGATLGLGMKLAEAGTLAFCAMAFAQTFNLLNVMYYQAGGRLTVFLVEVKSVPSVWMVLVGAVLLQVAAVYVPFFNNIFNTVPVSPLYLAGALAISALVMATACKLLDFKK